jgi:hypothetical protein
MPDELDLPDPTIHSGGITVWDWLPVVAFIVFIAGLVVYAAL